MSKRKQKQTTSSEPEPRAPEEVGDAFTGDPLAHSHLRIGWWSLLAFLTLGIVLEALHGLKVGWYLETAHATRRLMWTLAHAHGVLIALVHIAFAFTLGFLKIWEGRARILASSTLKAAGLLIPGGFFLGGLWIYDGDPGLGILLVPLGALCLFIAVLVTARGTGR